MKQFDMTLVTVYAALAAGAIMLILCAETVAEKLARWRRRS